MMKTILNILFLLCISCPVLIGQQDPAAKKVLDKFAQKAESSSPVKIKFEYVYESSIDNESYSESGILILDGNKYHLSIGESEIYCDGETLWNHVVSAKEVYISDPENSAQSNEFIISNPENLFSFYENDFKYRLTGEIEYQGVKYYQVDLFPKDPNKSYHTVTMLIFQKDYRLYSIETRGKQGINHTITITGYLSKYKTTEDMFRFDPSKYPDIEIVDTRL